MSRPTHCRRGSDVDGYSRKESCRRGPFFSTPLVVPYGPSGSDSSIRGVIYPVPTSVVQQAETPRSARATSPVSNAASDGTGMTTATSYQSKSLVIVSFKLVK